MINTTTLSVILVFAHVIASRLIGKPLRTYQVTFIIAIIQITQFRQYGYIGDLLIGDYWRFQLIPVVLLIILSTFLRIVWRISHRIEDTKETKRT